MQNTLERAAGFMYRHARPLDMARWRYHFEGGSREDVLKALSAYQNADGGFGHALEADCWNPHSSPIQTWCATEVLREVGLSDAGHPLIAGILRYLASGAAFDGHSWLNCLPENNDYPHAPWWTFSAGAPSGRFGYNPAACLAGFMLRYAAPGSEAHALGLRVAREAFDAYMAYELTGDMHIAQCCLRLYEYCAESAGEPPFDMEALRARACEHIALCLTRDVAQWEGGYVCRPSQFIAGPDSPWYACCPELARRDCAFIARTQQPDGAWPIPWSWPDYPAEWAVSHVWWQGDVIVKNMLYLRAFGQA